MPLRSPVPLAFLLVVLALAGCVDNPRADPDGDGLPNNIEAQFGTDPNAADTDGDGLNDFDEVITYRNRGVDPLRADTDGDGLSDREEVIRYGTRPDRSDTDGDGVDDFREVKTFAEWDCPEDGACTHVRGLNATKRDTDDDGWPDAAETEYWVQRLGSESEAGVLADTLDADGDGWRDGEDAEPLNDLSVQVRPLSFNLTSDFQDGGANLSLVLQIGRVQRTILVGQVELGTTQLDIATMVNVPDGPARPEDHLVTVGITALHAGDQSIGISGQHNLVVETMPVSDYTTTILEFNTTGDDASMTYRIVACRPDC